MEGKRNGVFRTKRNGQQRGCTKRLKRVVKVREGRGERDEVERGRRREQRAPPTKVRGGEEGSLWKKRKLTRRRSASEKAEKGEREKARGW